MGTVARSLRKGCEDRFAESERCSRTYLYEHGDASLAASGAMGRANARDGSGIAGGEDPKWLRRFWWKGDTRLLKSLLSQVPAETDADGVITSCRWDVAMIDRDFDAARTVLQNRTLTRSRTRMRLQPQK